MKITCDVLVVGAGPAGSSAARAAALNGANVILIEKNKKPGKIACGEAISTMLFPLLPFEIPRKQLKWKLYGMDFYAEGIQVERKGRFWESYSLDRREFDYWLAQQAVKAGAKLINSAELVDLEHYKYFVNRSIVKTPKGEIEIEPKILIAADDVESKTLNLLKLYKPKKGDIAQVHSWEMRNLKLTNPHIEQVYLGDYCDGGYAYIFPKSRTSANIGTGSMKNLNLKKLFNEFLELPQVKKQLKNGKRVIERSGKALARPFLKNIVFGNVLVVGDAAGQNFKPFVEGIVPAVICGDIAGKVAGRNLDLKRYPEIVKKRLGYIFDESNEITEILYELFSLKDNRKYIANLALAANLFSYDAIRKMKRQSYEKIKEMIEEESRKVLLPKIRENLECLYILLRSKIL
jgi:digeranylgeranylglycerophospholipid reductase